MASSKKALKTMEEALENLNVIIDTTSTIEVVEEVETPETVLVETTHGILEAAPAVAKVGVGTFCKDMILNSNWNNKEILEKVLETYPTAKTTYACIAWYRSDLRSKGLIGPRVHAKKEALVAEVVA